MSELATALGIGALVVLLAAFAVRVSVRLGLPSLLLYLAIGVLIGEAGLGVRLNDPQLTQALSLAALVLILTEGGLTTRWTDIRPTFRIGIALSTVGIVINIVVVAVALHFLLGHDWRLAMLWGAVLAPTDAAAVFSVLRGVGVSRQLAGSIELESGLNDAPSYLAVTLIASVATVSWTLPLTVLYELIVGAAIGFVFGWLGSFALRRVALPATGLYPLATVSVCVLAFATGQLAHASGILATYVSGLVLGNSHLPHRADTLSFAENFGWLSQIGLFVLLGLFASPSRLVTGLVPGLVASAVILLCARPLSVLASLLPFRVPWREQVFMSWAGLRGAIPIVLAMIPLSEGVSGAHQLVDAVFVLVVVLTVVQGGTLGMVAKALRLTDGAQSREVDVDVAPLEELDAELLQVRIPEGSHLHGVYLSELRLPVGATVSLIVRNGKGFTPHLGTRLQELDQLLVVVTAAARPAAERRIRAVDRAGPIARWRGETGD